MTTLSMAQNNVSIVVKGKDEASGVLNQVAGKINTFANNTKKSTSGLTNLGKSLGNLKNMVPGIGLVTAGIAGVTAAVAKTVKTMAEWENAFAQVEASSKRLDIAANLNKGLNGTSTGLKQFASNLSATLKNSFSGGELLEAMGSISFDKSSVQIKNITSTAADLSKALGMDLNTAVSQLNNTFSGTVGQLGKVFPELKNLTKEELEAGKAIDIVREKVKGTAEAMADTTAGSLQAYKNANSDLKEELGAMVTGYFTPLRNWLTTITKGWADALAAKRQYNEAETARANGTADADQLSLLLAEKQKELAGYNSITVGTDEYYANDGIESMKAQIQQDINALHGEIIAKQYQMAQARHDQEMKQLEEERKAHEEKMKLEAQKLADEKALAIEKKNQEGVKALQNANNEKEVNDQILAIRYQILQGEKDQESGIKEILALQDKNYAFAKKVDKGWADASIEAANSYMLNAEQAYLAQLNTERDRLFEEYAAKEKEAFDKELEVRKNMVDGLKSTVVSSTGQLGSIIDNLSKGDWMAALGTVISELVNAIRNASPIIEKIFNCVSTLIDYLAGPLATVFETVLEPLLGVINTLGKTLVMLIEFLRPVIENVIGPMLKGISMVLTTVLVGIYNAVVAIHNIFTSKSKDWAYLNLADELASLVNGSATAIAGASASSATGAASASYTAARDIYVNINFNDSYVNGDAMAIAINLRDKIREAEKMGY